MADWIEVTAVSELPPGSRKIVTTPYCEIAVFNLDGEFFAIEDVCSHDGGELASGLCEGDQIICPRHGARFCIRNGQALTPPAYENIDTFPVIVENGMVKVDIDG
ncbi:MAG: ferredoxin [Zetaproteobacteria bacterium CG_4_9_14_3_um_filter_53_7]|nr:MAG: ferredoxin [Zetaproteobacteria bacterium CG_4_9_14_3_um_filter_53_7]